MFLIKLEEFRLSLKDKFVKGAIWNTISQVGTQIINFIFTIVLARLLTPTDFGLFTQVMIIIILLCYFSDFGLAMSIIQKKEADDIDYSTAFWGILSFSIIIYVIVYFSAPLIAEFYKNNSMVLIIRIVFIQFLILPFSMINEGLEYKKLNYDKIVKSDLISQVFSGFIGIILAYNGFGVWSLVYQSLLSFLIKTIMILILTKWRPKFIFSITRFKELIRSGLQFTYRNLTLYMSENTDYLLIGKLAGATMLGIYSMAFRVSNYPFAKIQTILGRMLLPTFNMISHDLDKIRLNYNKLSYFGGLILIPFLITIYFGIDSFIMLVLGNKWIGATPIVKILVIYLFFSSLSFADDPLMLSLNKIKFVNLIKTIVTCSLFGFGFFAIKIYGTIGMAVIFTIVSIIYTITIKIILLKEINISIFEYLTKMKSLFVFGFIYALIQLLYSTVIIIFTKSPLVFLLGEGIIFLIFMVVILLNRGIFNMKTRKFNFDAI